MTIFSERGVDFRKLSGFCQNDILKEYIARGNFIFPPEPSVRLVVDILAYCSQYAPEYRPITVISAHYLGMGATPVQQGAYSLAMCSLAPAHTTEVELKKNKRGRH